MILGIEVSTSSAKALLYTSDLGVVKELSMTYQPEHANVVTMDLEGIFMTLKSVVLELVGDEGHKVTDIAISTIWNSLVFMDDQLKPLGKLMTWADTTGDSVWLEGQASDWSRTGCPKHYKFTRWKLGRSAARDHLAQGHKVGALSDWLFYHMTGRWCTSKMSASGSGLLDIFTGDWHVEALEKLSLKEDQLPMLVDWSYQSTIQETLAHALGLTKDVKVHIPNGDGGLNQYGEGGYDGGIMTMSVGTSAAIRRVTHKPNLTESQGLWHHYLDEGYWVTGATISGAGNMIDWFMKEINLDKLSFDQLEEGLVNLKVKDLPIFLPFMYGEQSPGWKNQRTYGYRGDKEGVSLLGLYYAVLEGILFNLKQGYEIMAKAYGQPKQILVSGGILHAPFWLKLAATILGQALNLSTNRHSSLAGAVRLVSGDRLTSSQEQVLPDATRSKDLNERYQRYLAYYHES